MKKRKKEIINFYLKKINARRLEILQEEIFNYYYIFGKNISGGFLFWDFGYEISKDTIIESLYLKIESLL